MAHTACDVPVTTKPDAHDFRKTAETFRPGAKTLPQTLFCFTGDFCRRAGEDLRETMGVGRASEPDRRTPAIILLQRVAGESLIVCATSDGAIRAFYNVCRHRGTRFAKTRNGHVRAIQCPYHAWTYGLDGRLIGAPHMDEVPGFDKADYPLQPREPWALGRFHLRESGERQSAPLEEWFAPLAGKFSHWNLPALRSAKRIEYDVRANWKLIFRELFGVLSLPGRASGVVESFALRFRGE